MAADKGTILLSAGGTGGHLFPAEALAHELASRGWSVHLATDERAQKYASSFPAAGLHVIKSATPSGKNPVKLVKAMFTLVQGGLQARKLIAAIKPAAVVGFGGYPTIPPLVAASGVVPTLIHEQNAVMGRANKFLSSRVTKIAGGFLKSEGPLAGKIVETGNPVRPAVIENTGKRYVPSTGDAPFNIVVFGGSQGAQYFSKTFPEALARLPEAVRKRLVVTQQARPEDEADAKALYEGIRVKAEVSPFFSDLPKRIAEAHLVLARSGASTVSEIAAIGRPAILVPYPHALDHDQAANAAALEAQGGAMVRKQASLDVATLGDLLADLVSSPDRLSEMAAAAARAGRPQATTLLADLTEAIASGQPALSNAGD